MEDRKYFVHPSSYIDDHVAVGDGTKIGRFCRVQAGDLIGRVCECGRRLDKTLKCPCGRSYSLDGEYLKKEPLTMPA